MNVYTKRQRIAEIAKHHREEPITLLHHHIDENRGRCVKTSKQAEEVLAR